MNVLPPPTRCCNEIPPTPRAALPRSSTKCERCHAVSRGFTRFRAAESLRRQAEMGGAGQVMKYLPTEGGDDDGPMDHSLVETLLAPLEEEKKARPPS